MCNCGGEREKESRDAKAVRTSKHLGLRIADCERRRDTSTAATSFKFPSHPNQTPSQWLVSSARSSPPPSVRPASPIRRLRPELSSKDEMLTFCCSPPHGSFLHCRFVLRHTKIRISSCRLILTFRPPTGAIIFYGINSLATTLSNSQSPTLPIHRLRLVQILLSIPRSQEKRRNSLTSYCD